MKQSLKYGILFIIALLLHTMTSEVMKELCTPSTPVQEICYVSQARPVHNAIEKFYHLYHSVLSFDAEHVDLSQIPFNKTFLRLTTRLREHRGLIPPSFDYSLHLYTHDPIDPLIEYIYGQRKIVI